MYKFISRYENESEKRKWENFKDFPLLLTVWEGRNGEMSNNWVIGIWYSLVLNTKSVSYISPYVAKGHHILISGVNAKFVRVEEDHSHKSELRGTHIGLIQSFRSDYQMKTAVFYVRIGAGRKVVEDYFPIRAPRIRNPRSRIDFFILVFAEFQSYGAMHFTHDLDVFVSLRVFVPKIFHHPTFYTTSRR